MKQRAKVERLLRALYADYHKADSENERILLFGNRDSSERWGSEAKLENIGKQIDAIQNNHNITLCMNCDEFMDFDLWLNGNGECLNCNTPT